VGQGVLPVQAGGIFDADEFEFHTGGYIRTIGAVSLNNHPETAQNDRFDPTMLRGILLLDTDMRTGPFSWKMINRFDREVRTHYLRRLRDLSALQSPGGSVGKHYLDQYNTTNFWDAVRELYVDFSMFDERVSARLGKQQLVWGESDFFQAMDLVHGFDFRWRLFFEDNEEFRKPLTMASFVVDAPELGGNLNFYVRPGIDRGRDIGSNFNIEGGRWIPHPYRGVDFTAFTDYNPHHSKAKEDDVTYGIRWSGELGSIGYSLAYLKVFNPTPVINPPSSTAVSGLFGVTSSTPFVEEPTNQVLGDWIYPKIDAFGVTANGYSSMIDSVLSAEVVFIPNKPYNYGQLASSLPGWQGIREKDTLSSMIRLDKNIHTSFLGTNRPSFSSVQLFDTWIIHHKKSDEIVEFASFGAPKKEHTVMLTGFIVLNYLGDTINPSLVVGGDLSNGGGFAITAIDFVFGQNWRLKIEGDFWWDDANKKPSATVPSGAHINPLGINENSTSFFGWFHGDNQVVIKVTRLF
jgi:hypothetical protein